MSRKWRVVWVIDGILLIVAFVAQWTLPTIGDTRAFSIIVLALASLVVWALVTLIMALFRAKGRPFRERVALRMPYTLAVTLCAMLGFIVFEYNWEGMHGVTIVEGRTYTEIPVAADCSSVHDGVFENEGMSIRRSGTSQFQRDKLTGSEWHLNVEWVSDCEYHVSDPNVAGATLRVKITEVDKEGFDCVYVGPATGEVLCAARFQRVR